MSENQHHTLNMDKARTGSKRMSDDSRGGGRNSPTPGADRAAPAGRSSRGDGRDESAIEAFEHEGAGIAAKE